MNKLTSPPLAELHDVHMGEAGAKLGMPVDEFAEQAYTALARGEEEVVIGSVGPKEQFDAILKNRRGAFGWLSGMMRKNKH